MRQISIRALLEIELHVTLFSICTGSGAADGYNF